MIRLYKTLMQLELEVVLYLKTVFLEDYLKQPTEEGAEAIRVFEQVILERKS
ncbi:hypothetical protein [Paenibacillus periandrae]|uniref:hypothetical protein n=1 Tax=Paenibacillus periandrae TaxID=1761741 RepID=UPI001F096C8E|nr:hypothetical protein [Paenibacillus periandrae]